MISILKRFAFQFIPRHPYVRDLMMHGLLTLILYLGMGLLIRKFLTNYLYTTLLALVLCALILGLANIWKLRRYPSGIDSAWKGLGLSVLITLVGCFSIFTMFRTHLLIAGLAITPFISMSIFFIEQVLSEWVNMPKYIPPHVTLENYTSVTGLRVFERSNTFVRFVLKGLPRESLEELPPEVAKSVVRRLAFNLSLGDLFSAFALYNNYNERGGQQIKVVDGETEEAYCWAFYRHHLGFWRRYLNPEKSLHSNRMWLGFSLWVVEGRVQFIRRTTIYVTRFNLKSLTS